MLGMLGFNRGMAWHDGYLTRTTKIPLQENGMPAISKISKDPATALRSQVVHCCFQFQL